MPRVSTHPFFTFDRFSISLSTSQSVNQRTTNVYVPNDVIIASAFCFPRNVDTTITGTSPFLGFR